MAGSASWVSASFFSCSSTAMRCSSAATCFLIGPSAFSRCSRSKARSRRDCAPCPPEAALSAAAAGGASRALRRADQSSRSPGCASIRPSRTSQICVARPDPEEHTSELQSLRHLVCRLLLEKKKKKRNTNKNKKKKEYKQIKIQKQNK